MQTQHLVSLAAALFLVSTASAQQAGIYVDVHNGPSNAGLPTSGYAAAAPVGGLWNELDLTASTNGVPFVSPPLRDINDQATGVTLTYDGLGQPLLTLGFDEPNTTGNDAALLDDIGFTNGSAELRWNGLPAGTYTIIVYAMAPDDATFLTSINVISSPDPQQNVGGSFAGGFAQGVTHSLHTATVAAGATLVIQVDTALEANSINGIQIFPGDAQSQVGTNYCGPAVPNGSGSSARLIAEGSAVANDNDLTLTCIDMPQLVFGFFIVSQVQGMVPNPGGSAGNLCLGGALGRYVGPGQIQSSGNAGSFSLDLDLASVPQPMGAIAVQPGSTWNWQGWFRDSAQGVSTSNFSDGLQIDFQ